MSDQVDAAVPDPLQQALTQLEDLLLRIEEEEELLRTTAQPYLVQIHDLEAAMQLATGPLTERIRDKNRQADVLENSLKPLLRDRAVHKPLKLTHGRLLAAVSRTSCYRAAVQPGVVEVVPLLDALRPFVLSDADLKKPVGRLIAEIVDSEVKRGRVPASVQDEFVREVAPRSATVKFQITDKEEE